jgi:hypothetical protein
MFIVRGSISSSARVPVLGARVAAFDRTLEAEVPVGEGVVDEDGRYSIEYEPGSYCGERKRRADLIVRALGAGGAVLAESSLIVDARPEETVDLVIDDRRPEIDRLMEALEPLYRCRPLIDWQPPDLEYAAAKIGAERWSIEALVRSVRLGEHHGLPAAAFFALLRGGLSSDLPALLAQGERVWREAFARAIDEAWIADLHGEVEAFVSRLARLAVEQELAPAGDPTAASAGEVLSRRMSPDAAGRLLEMFQQHDGTIEAFWGEARSLPELREPGRIEEAQALIQLANLTDHHLVLVDRLLAARAAGELASMRDLAAFDEARWRALVADVPLPAPPSGADEPEETRRDHLAAALAERVREAFPTAAVAYRLRQDDPEISAYLLAHPDLDLATTHVDTYTTEAPASAEVAARLKRVQRSFKLTPHAEEIRALQAAGFDSAHAIAASERDAFAAAVALPADRAKAIHDRSERVRSVAGAAWAQTAAQLDGADFSTLKHTTTTAALPASLVSLFGAQDYCACEHCRSLLSPAAYLVDLLELVANNTPQAAGLAGLRAKRPDLEHIELSCDNTNVPLPYIDLVNEILEEAVAPRPSPSPTPQTTATAAELRAAPEHLHRPAYDVVADAIFPLALPFELPWTEARLFLRHLGVERAELIDALPDPPTPTEARTDAIRREWLGLSPSAFRVIAGAAPPPPRVAPRPWELWGLAETEAALPDPLDHNATLQGTWSELVARVHVLMHRAAISYDELRALLSTDVVNPGGTITIEPIKPGVPDCDRSKLVLRSADAAAFTRMNRFVRLQRHLGWTIEEVDAAIQALGGGALDAACLYRLGALVRLRAELDLPVLELVSWYADLDTRRPAARPQYHALFIDRSVINPPDPALDPAALAPSVALSAHAAPVKAALGLDDADLALLLAGPAVLDGQTEAIADQLDLNNLSRLHRIASFCRAADLSVADFVALKGLTGTRPFDPTAPEQALELLALVRELRAASLSIAALDYLFRHQSANEAALASDPRLRAQNLDAIDRDLDAIIDATTLRDDPGGDALRTTLATLVSPPLLDLVLAVVADTAPAALDQAEIINKAFAPFLTTPAVRTSVRDGLIGAARLTDLAARRALVLLPALEWIRQRDAEAAIFERLSSIFSLEPTVVRSLLRDWLRSADLSRRALDDFLPLGVGEMHTASDGTLQQRRARRRQRLLDLWPRLEKAAVLVAASGLPATEMGRVVAPVGWLSLDDLPLAAEDDGVKRFAAWRRVRQLTRLRDGLLARNTALFDILDAVPRSADRRAFLVTVAAQTGWSEDDLAHLTGAGGFGFTFPADFEDERTLARIERALALAARLGVSAAAAHAWTERTVSADAAAQVVAAARAQVRPAQWLTVVQPLSDELRERRRDALVGRLLARSRLPDTNALFDRYLIDVEMSACQLTSRIKQAIGAVQLFIQRALFNREDAVLSRRGERHWSWMRSYRVWEANRKVFLYPENWIEPELRDDKTPFFKELEHELLEGELTLHAGEQAYRRYLAKLTEVANLEVRGLYHHGAADLEDADVVHVFARTRDASRRYFHRRRVDRWRWTPWEPMGVDIDAEHLIPFQRGRQLRLFWIKFGELDARDKTSVPSQLAWSDYRDERWTGKKVATRSFSIQKPVVINPDDRPALRRHLAKVSVWPRQQGEDLELYLRPTFPRGADALYAYPEDKLRFPACSDNVAVGGRGPGLPGRLHLPVGCALEHMTFVMDSGGKPLTLWSAPGVPFGFDFLAEVGDQEIRRQPVLGHVQDPFRVVSAAQYPDFLSNDVFVFEDAARVYFVEPTWQIIPWSEPIPRRARIRSPLFEAVSTAEAPLAPSPTPAPASLSSLKQPATVARVQRYRFHVFHHPFVCELQQAVDRHGLDGLLRPPFGTALHQQRKPEVNDFNRYAPTSAVSPTTYPVQRIDFSRDGAYSAYNWELFFHVPFLIAERLRQAGRFEEAARWFHFVFDPASESTQAVPDRYWRFGPFADTKQRSIAQLLGLLAGNSQDMFRQVEEWRDRPFEPHRLAALRPTAYPRAVVMKYLDNLIGWGDQLFRRETLEAINEATLLYVLAAQILGPRPVRLPPTRPVAPRSYATLVRPLDAFSNSWEELLPALPEGRAPDPDDPPPPTMAPVFCIPANEKLLAYWDTVADRLFKIRHCQDLDGRERELPLFEPPIDPALLVRARAAGLDIGSILRDVHAPRPHYRFTVLAAKASELCGEVRGLGGSLLGVLQARDGEKLALLRAGQETRLLELVGRVRERQLAEAEQGREALLQARQAADDRARFYRERKHLSPSEQTQLARLADANQVQQDVAAAEEIAAAHNVLPSFSIPLGPIGGPSISYGGSNVGAYFNAVAREIGAVAAQRSYESSRAGLLGGFERRKEEWDFQARQAQVDVAQIDRQLAAADIRVEIARQELANHQQQVENARAVEDFLHDKFTSQELYGWMLGQISAVYFRAHQLAYDLAKRAERAYRFELGLADSRFVQFGHWDGLYRGLLAGDRLALDLKTMEASYLELNQREHEITKHVSLATLAPADLVALRTRGVCYVELPESLFDRDHPGHYLRRLRTVSVTIPCVAGPYTSINCKLTLLWSRIRRSADVGTSYAPDPAGDDRFVEEHGAQQSIVTSSGQADSGLFDAALRDERYLPFEGSGVVSRWRVELPHETNAFDRASLSDLVLHLRYTSRDGGDRLRAAARTATDVVGSRLFSARAEFPSEWHRFLHPEPGEPHALSLPMSPERFPAHPGGPVQRLARVDLFVVLARGVTYPQEGLRATLTPAGAAVEQPDWLKVDRPGERTPQSEIVELPHLVREKATGFPATEWTLQLSEIKPPLGTAGTGSAPARLTPSAIVDIGVFCVYRLP